MRKRAEVGIGWTILVLGAGLVAGIQCALYLFDLYDDGIADPVSGLIGVGLIFLAIVLALKPYFRRVRP